MPFGDFWKLPIGTRPPANVADTDPTAGLTGLQKFNYALQYRRPEINALAAGISAGDIGSGFRDMGVIQQRNQEQSYEADQQNQKTEAMYQYLKAQGLSEAEARAGSINPAIAQHVFQKDEQAAQDAARLAQLESGADKLFQPRLYSRPKPGGKPGEFDYVEAQPSHTAGGGVYTVFGDELKPEDGWQPLSPGEREYQRTLGGNQADAVTAYPAAVQAVDSAVQAVDALSANPDLDYYAGVRSMLSPGWLDTPAYKTWLADFKLAAGNTFLTAFASLKGGGPISDREGKAAQDAIAAIEPGMTADGIRKQLSIAREHMKNALLAAQERAGGRGIEPPGRPDLPDTLAMPPAQGGKATPGATRKPIPFRVIQ